MNRRAVILAGGRGTRLRPYTVVLPKPLMPIGDYPILEVIVRQLVQGGFDRITLAVNHQAELLRAFFGDGSRWSVAIDYSQENQTLSTMGPLRLIADLPEDFLVMNGDVLTDLSFAELLDEHARAHRSFTISAHRRVQKIEYGVLQTDTESFLSGFSEKPEIPYLVSMGVYAVNRRVLEYIPPNVAYGFDSLMLDLMKGGRPAYVRSYNGYWLDIGRPDDYAEAIELFESKQSVFLRG